MVRLLSPSVPSNNSFQPPEDLKSWAPFQKRTNSILGSLGGNGHRYFLSTFVVAQETVRRIKAKIAILDDRFRINPSLIEFGLRIESYFGPNEDRDMKDKFLLWVQSSEPVWDDPFL